MRGPTEDQQLNPVPAQLPLSHRGGGGLTTKVKRLGDKAR